MGNIRQLDRNTIDKIAAGEVIERPAAVVKELVENAIDAKSSAITIEIKEGGISMIRITDNGSGIQKDDIKTAFMRHATSKISSVEDLFTVKSLGFRGEALSSISAVAQVELITKVSSELLGVRYVIEGGEEKSEENIGCPEGTTFIVRNLFYNTPVRRKFLKSANTEAGYVADLVERLAVSHTDIAFKFIANGQTKLHTSGNGNLKDIIYNIYGREIASNVKEVNDNKEKSSVYGYVGKPIISRGNRNYENYYINGRYIKSNIIYKAIEEAYKPFMMQHRYPFVSLHLTIDNNLIDVNVHPTKMEIRFSNPNEIYDMVYHAILDALNETNLIPEVELVKEKEKDKVKVMVPEPFEVNRRHQEVIQLKRNETNTVKNDKKDNIFKTEYTRKTINPFDIVSKKQESAIKVKCESDNFIIDDKIDNKIDKAITENKKISQNDTEEHTIQKKAVVEIEKAEENAEKEHIYLDNSNKIKDSIVADNKPEFIQEKNKIVVENRVCEQVNLFDNADEKDIMHDIKIIGQVFLTYWIVEYDKKMYIIDQHAAHEKVMYERIMKNLAHATHNSQIIAPSIIITLSMREEEKLKKYMDVFTKLGFEIEHFGGKDYCISAVPADMFGIANKELFIELLDAINEAERGTPEVILEKTASMACKAAVKGNTKMSVYEAEALIKEMLSLDNPFNCPHGRPTTISLTKTELEKKFKRQL